MSDLELLRLAAKAIGRLAYDETPDISSDGEQEWNPLTDDGDAFRIAVQLAMFNGSQMFHFRSLERFGNPQATELECTRRAIVRAAAEIGKSMP